MEQDLIVFKKEGNVAFIGLNRPQKLNALNLEMLEQLNTYLDHIENKSDVRTVIIHSFCPKAFSVGADIHAFSSFPPLMKWKKWVRAGHSVIEKIANLLQPVIAVTNGYAFGGGLELAAAADFRIAEENSMFALPEVSIGTLPGWAGHRRVLDLIGPARLKMMVFTGERINTSQALEYGLIDQIAKTNQGLDKALKLCEKIAGNSPVSIQLAKQVIKALHQDQPVTVLESMASAIAAFSSDGQEGVSSFLEKREPHFSGD